MIYFDNAATTKLDNRVSLVINDINEETYGNPSSLSKMGFLAEKKVKESSDYILKFLNANSDDYILWTSGGTESNNTALKCIAKKKAKTGKHIITTKIEHPSILNVVKYLESEGFEISYVPVDSYGHVNIDELKNMIRNDTIICSIMHVNNEIGSINDIENIGKVIKEKNNNIIFHVDCIQSFGKLKIDVKKMNIDMLSTSAHKIHGPKGVGFLYIKNGVIFDPLIIGGGQQDGLRSGTLNVPGIVGMYEATKIINDNFTEYSEKLCSLRDYLKELLKNTPYIVLGGEAPHIMALVLKDVRAEVMVHSLEDKNIYVGAGSACSSHSKHTSNTLTAIGIKPELQDKVIRISFSRYNTKQEIDTFVGELNKRYEMLSKFVRK